MKNAIRTSLPTHLRGTTAGLNTKTRIMASLGTALKPEKSGKRQIDLLRAMVQEGASIFRINAAHLGDDPNGLSREEGRLIIQDIQKLRMELRQLIPIYFDLAGPKLRVDKVLALKPFFEKGRRAHPAIGDFVDLYLPVPENDAVIGPLVEFHKTQRVSDWDKDDQVRRFYDDPSSPALRAGAKLLLQGDLVDFSRIKKDKPVNLKDGRCQLKIVDAHKYHLHCVVESADDDFEFREKQGASPCQYAFDRVITAQDKDDILWAVQRSVDVISLSFVCSPHDAKALREEIRDAKKKVLAATSDDEQAAWSKDRRKYLKDHEIPIFAKIETAFAVEPGLAKEYAERLGPPTLPIPQDPLREIIEAFDGVMVARGDLAIEIEKYEVPHKQRRILELARQLCKPAIVATEILQSMQKGGTSTRAEISDINSAVWEEADILMLSGETATGKNPVKVVTEMRKAIRAAEHERCELDLKKNFQQLADERQKTIADRVPERAELAVFQLPQASYLCESATTLNADAMLVSAGSGHTAREVSGFRPWQQIITVSDDLLTGVELSLHRGVFPVVTQHPLERTIEDFIDIANEIHHRLRIPYRPNGGSSFIVPGSVRIEPRIPTVHDSPAELNSIVYLFQIPKRPEAAPEIERKYALLAEQYETLRKALKTDAKSWTIVEQLNFYFTDVNHALLEARWSLRLRRETLIDAKDRSPFERPIAFYFTIKKARKVKDGEPEVYEEEYDVTREVVDEHIWGLPSTPLLPPWAVDRVKELFAEQGTLEGAIEFIDSMVNTRTVCHMPNDLVLELDESRYRSSDPSAPRVEYELEVELRNDERTRLLLDEYIPDKCAANHVQLIRVDNGDPPDCLIAENLDYPSKVAQVLAGAGLLSERARADVHKAVTLVREKLAEQVREPPLSESGSA